MVSSRSASEGGQPLVGLQAAHGQVVDSAILVGLTFGHSGFGRLILGQLGLGQLVLTCRWRDVLVRGCR